MSAPDSKENMITTAVGADTSNSAPQPASDIYGTIADMLKPETRAAFENQHANGAPEESFVVDGRKVRIVERDGDEIFAKQEVSLEDLTSQLTAASLSDFTDSTRSSNGSLEAVSSVEDLLHSMGDHLPNLGVTDGPLNESSLAFELNDELVNTIDNITEEPLLGASRLDSDLSLEIGDPADTIIPTDGLPLGADSLLDTSILDINSLEDTQIDAILLEASLLDTTVNSVQDMIPLDGLSINDTTAPFGAELLGLDQLLAPIEESDASIRQDLTLAPETLTNETPNLMDASIDQLADPLAGMGVIEEPAKSTAAPEFVVPDLALDLSAKQALPEELLANNASKVSANLTSAASLKQPTPAEVGSQGPTNPALEEPKLSFLQRLREMLAAFSLTGGFKGVISSLPVEKLNTLSKKPKLNEGTPAATTAPVEDHQANPEEVSLTKEKPKKSGIGRLGSIAIHAAIITLVTVPIAGGAYWGYKYLATPALQYPPERLAKEEKAPQIIRDNVVDGFRYMTLAINTGNEQLLNHTFAPESPRRLDALKAIQQWEKQTLGRKDISDPYVQIQPLLLRDAWIYTQNGTVEALIDVSLTQSYLYKSKKQIDTSDYHLWVKMVYQGGHWLIQDYKPVVAEKLSPKSESLSTGIVPPSASKLSLGFKVSASNDWLSQAISSRID